LKRADTDDGAKLLRDTETEGKVREAVFWASLRGLGEEFGWFIGGFILLHGWVGNSISLRVWFLFAVSCGRKISVTRFSWGRWLGCCRCPGLAVGTRIRADKR
jgi:hypothetical protein